MVQEIQVFLLIEKPNKPGFYEVAVSWESIVKFWTVFLLQALF